MTSIRASATNLKWRVIGRYRNYRKRRAQMSVTRVTRAAILPVSIITGSVGTCKPNSVRHFCRGDHSSRLRVAAPLQRPTRTLGGPSRPAERQALGRALIRPYLVLLRVGFAMQRSLLNARCALTAPFHPYLLGPTKPVYGFVRVERRYRLCGTVRRTALKPPLPGVIRHTALWSSDFPLLAPHSPANRAPASRFLACWDEGPA